MTHGACPEEVGPNTGGTLCNVTALFGALKGAKHFYPIVLNGQKY